MKLRGQERAGMPSLSWRGVHRGTFLKLDMSKKYITQAVLLRIRVKVSWVVSAQTSRLLQRVVACFVRWCLCSPDACRVAATWHLAMVASTCRCHCFNYSSSAALLH